MSFEKGPEDPNAQMGRDEISQLFDSAYERAQKEKTDEANRLREEAERLEDSEDAQTPEN